jgi:uncharacterized protein YndB with AHSA1/START domain
MPKRNPERHPERNNDKRASAVDLSDRATIATPSDREIVITRAFAAPRRVVFDAWTRSEHVAHWWDPGRTPLAVCEIDLRPDGAFRFVHQGPPGSAHQFTGTYREIVPPERLVFTTESPSGAQSVGTLVFTEREGMTSLTMTIACQSKADRDALLKMRVDVGTMRTLENLEQYLRLLPQA